MSSICTLLGYLKVIIRITIIFTLEKGGIRGIPATEVVAMLGCDEGVALDLRSESRENGALHSCAFSGSLAMWPLNIILKKVISSRVVVAAAAHTFYPSALEAEPGGSL